MTIRSGQSDPKTDGENGQAQKHRASSLVGPRDVARSARSAEAAHLAGVIEVRGILGAALAELGARIVGGAWLPGEAIPKMADLCDDMGVSRSVVRESFRILGAKGLVRSCTSDGTRVLPRSECRLLSPDVMDWRIKAGDTTARLHDLMRVRLVLEPGVMHTATAMAAEPARAHPACVGHQAACRPHVGPGLCRTVAVVGSSTAWSDGDRFRVWPVARQWFARKP